MEVARRIQNISSAIFNEMEELKKQVEKRGIEVINLGVGSPDRPPAPHIIEAMHRALNKLDNYRYPLVGRPELCRAVANWYKNRFGVELNPDNEVLVLMGSQDGLAHIAMAYINPGDIALIPDPGYPIYATSIVLAEGEIYPMPLLAENNFLPDLKNIPREVARRAKLLWVNYPNNPVAASANRQFFAELVDFARTYDIVVCHDIAYCELAFDGYKPVSFLEVPGAREVGIEFYSLSKTYNMAGCRVGFAVGNAGILEALNKIKTNIDYGVFNVVQEAGVAALEGPQDCVRENAECYRRRRDVLVDGLAKLGWEVPRPKASMFVWAPLPKECSCSSREFALKLLNSTGVLLIPGTAFGEMGEGYLRIALVRDEPVLEEAVRRIGEFLRSGVPA
ncbi:LL-diaminopimelate aminotransferase [Desulfallas thermosapovorans]|uniref:Aminotransferase n=1 Tax=Desulfallas thermosapovorans DSM 6562 TaxID=1121431 RepID=A0A5S4ZY68_9FIRM|nr:LL-diaminopimelate aminotransferase [Desulfallas thermosapovorans]TYO97848.1 LL-diaminopimelate aminotransferase [Desulfallas thermosapovorans DSM 6562]